MSVTVPCSSCRLDLPPSAFRPRRRECTSCETASRQQWRQTRFEDPQLVLLQQWNVRKGVDIEAMTA